MPDRPVPQPAWTRAAGRRFHAHRAAAGTGPAPPRPHQGGPARPDRHRGIGNIYADEVLRQARIHPARPAGSLSQAEARRLHAAIQGILRAAADSGGTSFAGYANEARGRPGYLGQAHVYRRQGLPCDVCGTPVIRTTVAGRATNYCPHCQQRQLEGRRETAEGAGKLQA
ncbi:MAG: zinc finger domain-containing protein [Trebonia sp.]